MTGTVDAMRIVGGTHRGRSIRSPSGSRIRPTSDRAREAIFNSLFSMGLPAEAVVVDAFAGTGAMGLEAASRGAAEVVFIDASPQACAIIEANLDDLGLSGTVVVGDAVVGVASVAHADLVLADPPYAFDDWERFVGNCPAAVLVLESDREIDVEGMAGWRLLRRRRYGAAVVTVLAPDDEG